MRHPEFKRKEKSPPFMKVKAKWVDGFEGIYAVTIEGNVFSYSYGKPRELKPKPKKNGYKVVTFYAEKKPIYRYVHRLVAEAFLGDVAGMQIDHIDCNRTNNKLENLEIVTRRENLKRMSLSNLKTEDILSIRNTILPMGRSCADIANIYGVSRQCISDIKFRRSWKDVG